jgi:hypothetical protein
MGVGSNYLLLACERGGANITGVVVAGYWDTVSAHRWRNLVVPVTTFIVVPFIF